MIIQEETKEETTLDKVSDALRKFWLEKSKSPIIKARHAEIYIEPKVFLAGKLNSEISKLIVGEYLAKASLEDIAKGRIIINSDVIKINDDKGSLIATVKNKRLINEMINKITNFLGKALSGKKGSEGIPYTEIHENGSYTFGDIKEGLVQFTRDSQKNDSKNLVRDALILLQNNAPQKISHP